MEVEWPVAGLWGVHHTQIMLDRGPPPALCITEHLGIILFLPHLKGFHLPLQRPVTHLPASVAARV